MFAARFGRRGSEYWSSKAIFIVRMLPYGVWTCADGREVLFDRDYTPICQRTPPGPASPADPEERVRHISSHHFYVDGTPERRKRAAAMAVLAEWDFVEPVLTQAEDMDFLSKAARAGATEAELREKFQARAAKRS